METTQSPKHFNFNGLICTQGEVYQKARKACSGATDYLNKIDRLEVGDQALHLKRLGIVKRIAYP